MTKFAFVFPGQGSQSRGMMNGYAGFAVVRNTFAEASDVLKQDLWQLVTEGSDADLNSTVNTQPIMLTAGVAVYRAWQSQNGANPAIMAGHSLGEYTALVAAGALRFTDALPLVAYRAHGMERAKTRGAKRAIMLPMSVPSHCRLLKGAAEQLRAYLDNVTVQTPGIPVQHNADVKRHSDAAEIRESRGRRLN